ncbi:MAG: hypothetical protein LBG91_05070 [Treponema sp.]|jgi:hypothetical protein|nr:hypothetical protein [Treponema sp.]
MKKRCFQKAALIFGTFAALALLACPVPESKTLEKPVDSIQILKNGVLLEVNDGGNPYFTIQEGKSVILSAKLSPDGSAGIHWQSSRRIVDLSDFSGQEITLFARYGGDTYIDVRARNALNETVVYSRINITVTPVSYYKWDYQLDGWKDSPALKPVTVDRIYNKMLVRSGSTPINEDVQRGGLVMEGPSTLIIGSVMSSPTNSVYAEDPLFDESALFNFTKIPSDKSTTIVQPPYTLKVRLSVDYEILSGPALRQGMRLQVNNNTEERDNASVLTNWLVAEYTSASPGSGTLTGIFDTALAKFEPGLDPDRKNRIPGMPSIILDPVADSNDVQEIKRLRKVLSNSFVCLSVPDGKVLIRSIRIETAD